MQKLTRQQAKKLYKQLLKTAEELYSQFHWENEPEEYYKINVTPPKFLVEMGSVVKICYATAKGREEAIWEHDFSYPYPLLCHDNAMQLFIIGGNYTIDDSGIIG